VSFIGHPLLGRGLDAGAGTEPLHARVRSEARDDLVVEADGDGARLSVAPVEGSPAIEGDPAARLLLLWGRKPTPFYRLRSGKERWVAANVQALLSGY
jgi:hypothetical protein